MKKWTKCEALTHLDTLINSVPEIKRCGRKSSEHIRWVSNALRFLEEVYGSKSWFYANLSNLSWQETGNMIIDARNFESESAAKHHSAFLKQMDQAKGFLESAKDQLEDRSIDEVNTSVSPIPNDFIRILKLGETKLRKLIRIKPKTEREIQDSYEDLLIATDIPFSREYPHIEYSSKQYIPDFSFAEFDLVVELKLCKLAPKKLIAQLNDDIVAYKTKFTNIVFIIYDLGEIRDIDEFKGSFENQEGVFVQIIKH